MAFKFKLITTFILALVFFSVNAQSTKEQNTLTIYLNIPVFIDEIIKTEYIPEKMEDKLQEYYDKATSVGFRVNNCKLNYAENRFWGSWQNEYFPYAKLKFSGIVTDDHMTLKYMRIEYTWKVDDNYRKEEEHLLLSFKNVPMFNGICFFDKSISEIKLSNYNYSCTEISKDYYTRTITKLLKSANYEDIPANPKLASGKFRIVLKMEGPPSFIVETKNIRGPDPEWRSPIARMYTENKTPEPRSIGIYRTKVTGFETDDLFSEAWEKGLTNELIILFSRVPLYHVLERVNIDKIAQEIKLSESGLVEKDSKVANKLMFEEIAIIPRYQGEKKFLSITVDSAKGQKQINIYNASIENLFEIKERINPIIEECVKELIENN